MKVSKMIEMLSLLPQDHEIIFERETNYGRVDYEFSHLEVRKEVKPTYSREMITPESMRIMMDEGAPIITGIEETPERCIMVLS